MDHSRIRWSLIKTNNSINFRTFLAGRGVHNVSVGMKTQDYAWILLNNQRKERISVLIIYNILNQIK